MRSRLVIDESGNKQWIQISQETTYANDGKKMNAQGEDLSIDGYINKYGGIKSVIDDSIHLNKASYNDHLKRNNKTIKDW